MSVVAMLQGTEDVDRSTCLAALSLAKRMNVSLSGVCALPDPTAAVMVVAPMETTAMNVGSIEPIIELQKELLTKARSAFDDVMNCGAHGVAAEFVHEVNIAERSAADAATLADAVVFPREAAKGGEPLNPSFQQVLLHSRLPVVLAGTGDVRKGPVIVAWDGSDGAARAVRFFLPVIRAMGKVIIAQNKKDIRNDDFREAADPSRLIKWLGQGGVEAETAELEGGVGTGLLALAKGSDASMIVAGAYGHSPLAERVFGGTTRCLLEADEAPMLALSR
ncbi:MAG: universal stress protein [Hyphomonas sp.]